jgi:tryptophan synthase alpha chain
VSNRIAARFAARREQGRTALVPFVTAGDPLPDATVAVMHALVGAGADLLELGMPFSDPMADGPVIQHADERALKKRVAIADVLGWVDQFRERDDETPVVLMGYLNPVMVHGIGRFAREAVDAGVDGMLAVDCPVEEDDTLQPIRDAGLQRILLIAPTTSEARLTRAVDAAEGYLYYVSFAGITGAPKLSPSDIARRVAALRARAKVPVAVGFGIKDAVAATAVAAFADGVVIGSALVERLAGAGDQRTACRRACDFLAPIREALDARRPSG